MSADQEIDILHPDREMTLSGEAVTVREYGFVEGLKLQQRARAMIEALGELLAQGEPSLMDLQSVFSADEHLLTSMLAQAIDRPPEFVAGLSDRQGQDLLMTWWAVNADFFVKRLVAARAGTMLSSRIRRSAAAKSASAASMPN